MCSSSLHRCHQHTYQFWANSSQQEPECLPVFTPTGSPLCRSFGIVGSLQPDVALPQVPPADTRLVHQLPGPKRGQWHRWLSHVCFGGLRKSVGVRESPYPQSVSHNQEGLVGRAKADSTAKSSEQGKSSGPMPVFDHGRVRLHFSTPIPPTHLKSPPKPPPTTTPTPFHSNPTSQNTQPHPIHHPIHQQLAIQPIPPPPKAPRPSRARLTNPPAQLKRCGSS